jgi:hypothetical protein
LAAELTRELARFTIAFQPAVLVDQAGKPKFKGKGKEYAVAMPASILFGPINPSNQSLPPLSAICAVESSSDQISQKP